MPDKVTSIKVDPELWKQAKLLAVKRGVTLKSMIESMLWNEIEAGGIEKEDASVSQKLLEILIERRARGKIPFAILTKKSAVELVREGRGE